jgi:HAD superfamily hydrolase (TIGR01509 family)
MTRAHPAAILGLRRCTARASQGTWITAFWASTAIAGTVSRRGWRRPHHTPMTIPATGEANLYWGVSAALKKGAVRARWRSRRQAAGAGVPAAAGAWGPGSRNIAYEQVIGRLLGVDDRDLVARALADLRPRPEIVDLVSHARTAGVRAAALSNSWGTGGCDPYDGYGLDDLFDAVVISDQVGLRKPDPAIYLLTAAKIGVPAADCIFVDDTAANLPAARDLGMATVHFTDAEAGVAEIDRMLGIA